VPGQRLAQQDGRQLAHLGVGRGLEARGELRDGLGFCEGGLEGGLGLAADLKLFLLLEGVVVVSVGFFFAAFGVARRRFETLSLDRRPMARLD
jgi:hypothetical protein